MPSAISSWLSRLAVESGFKSIANCCSDTRILCAQRFVRLFAYGASFLILVHFLSGCGFSDERIGLFMTLTLLGDVVISFVLTSITDQVGRRKIMAAGAVLMVFSGIVFFFSRDYWVLLLASVFGVISPSGNEIGPFRAVEESILAQLTVKEKRSDIFAWYTLFGTAGAAVGTFTSGWVVQALENSWNRESAYRAVFLIYAALGVTKLVLTFLLSPATEVEQPKSEAQEADFELEEGLLPDDERDGLESAGIALPHKHTSGTATLNYIRSFFPTISPASRSIVYQLMLLFTLDSFASGMASPSWLTYFFTTVHSLQPSVLGTLFLVTNILATLSNLAALPIARRLGPLRTMVFTHLPSAIFLAFIPIPPAGKVGTWLAMALLTLRACTQSMDQAPRQAFLSAAVLPSERTAVLGWVNIGKTLAQAGGIGSAGVLAGRSLWVVVLSGAGLMKALYDVLMLLMFRNLKDREDEQADLQESETE